MAALTLTGLIPPIMAAFNTVSREQAGLSRAVSVDANNSRAAQGQVVRSHVVAPIAGEDLTPSNVAGDTPAATVNYIDVTINKVRSFPFGITGEETRGLQNAGTLGSVNADRIAEAIRAAVNEVEADLAALAAKASRAVGTAAGTPFGTAGDLSDFAAARRMLSENGSPSGDLKMVLGASNIERIRGKQSTLFKVNEAGTDDMLREGNIGRVQGFALGESHPMRNTVAVGTGTAYTSSAAAFTVGQTAIPIITGSGTVLAGDIVTFAGDPRQYVVEVGVAGPGTITIAKPGIQLAQGATAKAMTITAATTRSMFFHKNAIKLLMRAPAMPEGGDAADDVMVLTDPNSGLVFEFAVYKGKRQNRYEVNAAWGCGVVNPAHIGLLIGAA